MKKKLLVGMVLPLALLACIIPGLTLQPGLSPTTDPNIILTIIVQTAQVLAAQTVMAASLFTPTSLPTETATLPPPTQAPILPTVDTSKVSNTSIEKLADGATLFTDQQAAYNVIIPAGWLAIRVNGPEYFEALTLPEAGDPAIQISLGNIQKQNSDIFRIFALDTRQGHTQDQYVTNLNMVWDQQDNNSLQATLEQIGKQYPLLFPGIKILNLNEQILTTGIHAGFVESEWRTKNNLGLEFTLYQRQIAAKLKSGTLIITLSTTAALKETVSPDIDRMAETLNIAAP